MALSIPLLIPFLTYQFVGNPEMEDQVSGRAAVQWCLWQREGCSQAERGVPFAGALEKQTV